MKLLKNYLNSTLSNTFFPIFLSLFTITSVVFLVKIASLTSVITLTFGELGYMFLLRIPLILYYTLPVTFFISIILNLSKLSGEYELIVVSSFGFSPFKLLRFLFPISFYTTIALFVISFILIPKTDYLESKFINEKNQEAQFNIKPSEYGQVFGPWFIYVEGKEKNTYKDITLFQPSEGKDIFVRSQSATITNKDRKLQLELQNGTAMSIVPMRIQQISYKEMILMYDLKEVKKINSLGDLIVYWKNTDPNSSQMRLLIQNIFIVLFPLISLFFYVGFGFFNPRYEKNKSAIYAIGLTILYMIATQKIATFKDFDLLFIFVGTWIVASFIVYKIRIKPYY